MTCTNCSSPVPDTAKVCGYCGSRLRDSSGGLIANAAILDVESQSERSAPTPGDVSGDTATQRPEAVPQVDPDSTLPGTGPTSDSYAAGAQANEYEVEPGPATTVEEDAPTPPSADVDALVAPIDPPSPATAAGRELSTDHPQTTKDSLAPIAAKESQSSPVGDVTPEAAADGAAPPRREPLQAAAEEPQPSPADQVPIGDALEGPASHDGSVHGDEPSPLQDESLTLDNDESQAQLAAEPAVAATTLERLASPESESDSERRSDSDDASEAPPVTDSETSSAAEVTPPGPTETLRPERRTGRRVVIVILAMVVVGALIAVSFYLPRPSAQTEFAERYLSGVTVVDRDDVSSIETYDGNGDPDAFGWWFNDRPVPTAVNESMILTGNSTPTAWREPGHETPFAILFEFSYESDQAGFGVTIERGDADGQYWSFDLLHAPDSAAEISYYVDEQSATADRPFSLWPGTRYWVLLAVDGDNRLFYAVAEAESGSEVSSGFLDAQIDAQGMWKGAAGVWDEQSRLLVHHFEGYAFDGFEE